jgi:hypothetical protein
MTTVNLVFARVVLFNESILLFASELIWHSYALICTLIIPEPSYGPKELRPGNPCS